MKTSVGYILLLFGITAVSGVVDMSCSSSRPGLGNPVTCTCTTDSSLGIDWQNDGGSLMLCFSSDGTCDFVPPEYEVSHDISGSSKIFQITIKTFSYSDCGNLTCKDQAGLDTVTESLSLHAFDPSVPASLTENIVSGSGQIEIATDCLYRKDEIKATWYTVSEGNENIYIPDSNYSTPSPCASDVCGAETANTLKIGFNYNKATKNPLEVKFKLKVYHEFNSSLQLELTTVDNYYIESTPGPKCWCLCQEGGKCFVCLLICFLVIEFIVGCMIGGCLICQPEALKGCLECKSSDCSECCSKFCKRCDNNTVRCKCCGSCCDIGGVPFWYYILLWTFIGAPVAFGIFIVMKCRKCGNGDVKPKEEKQRHETQSRNTRTGRKKPETKKNESKDSVAHIENEQHNQGRKQREQPPPPSDAGAATGTAMHGREDSDSAVSREHVHIQESGRTLPQSANDRQGHDSKGRGLSATFNDEDHPLVAIDTPSQKKGALESLPERTGGEGSVKKLKKKKKKSKDREDEM